MRVAERRREEQVRFRRLLNQAGAQGDRDRVGAVAGAQAGQGGLRVSTHGLGAQLQPVGDVPGRVAVGEELDDLALAPGQGFRPLAVRPPGR